MPLKTGPGSVDFNIAELSKTGRPRKQVIAIAMKQKRKKKKNG